MTNIIATIVITIATNLMPQVPVPVPMPTNVWAATNITATNWTYWGWLYTNGVTLEIRSNHTDVASNAFNYTVLIKNWATEGKVCEVLGHKWRDGCDIGIGCCVLGCYENSRYCPVCKTVQRRSNPEWK